MPAPAPSPSAESPTAKPPVNIVAVERGWYRFWAGVCIGLGLLLLAYNLSGPWAGAGAVVAYWPALVIGLGAGLPFAGRWARGFNVPAFACERDGCEAAELWVTAGTADVEVEAFSGSSQVAVGQFPNPAGPQVTRAGAVTRLVMDRRAAAPLLAGRWTAALGKGLPWTLNLRASVGAFVLNLRDCTVAGLDLESWAGPVELTLPAAGAGELYLRLGLGDLTVRLPDGVGVWLKFEAGPLASLKLNGRRWVRVAADEWATPDYANAAQQCRLRVALWAGDLKLV